MSRHPAPCNRDATCCSNHIIPWPYYSTLCNWLACPKAPKCCSVLFHNHATIQTFSTCSQQHISSNLTERTTVYITLARARFNLRTYTRSCKTKDTDMQPHNISLIDCHHLPTSGPSASKLYIPQHQSCYQRQARPNRLLPYHVCVEINLTHTVRQDKESNNASRSRRRLVTGGNHGFDACLSSLDAAEASRDQR
jgi:hypothetical protein